MLLLLREGTSGDVGVSVWQGADGHEARHKIRALE
jgi:hypothetical protein